MRVNITSFRYGWVLLLSLFSVVLFAQATLPDNFDTWLEEARQDWNIPGMIVGVVKDGEVLYARGFGEKRLGSGEMVDDNTIFSIASVSKNMTAAALAILVDEGKIHWDDPIVKHIPWFQFKDPWITREATLRDALTHRIGLGRILGNRLHFMTNSSRDEVLYQMRYMDFEIPFRSGFVYNNIMYSLAGQIIEYTDGRSWDDFMKEELFAPLEMHTATTSITDLKKTDNLAYPHQEIDGKIVPIIRRNWDNAGPAAGVNASVNDLNKWMLFQLGTPGEYKGNTVISTKKINELRKAQNVRRQADPLAPIAGYGFGWGFSDYEGLRVISHGGATDGFNTAMYIVPELDLGIVFSGNTFNGLGGAVAYQVIDAMLGIEGQDWSKTYLERYEAQYKRAAEARKEIHDARIENTQPTLSLADYAGTYISEGYGKMEVRLEQDALVMRFWDSEDLEAKLEHWHYDTFRAVWKNRAQREEFLGFQLGFDGKVESLEFEYVLRPMLLQVGAYPSNYTHKERFLRE